MSSPPAWTMGVSRKSFELKPGTPASPGPGSYNTSPANKTKQPSWKLGKSGRIFKYESISPGPAAYSIPNNFAKNAPKYPFGAKINLEPNVASPGPGFYESKVLLSSELKAPAYTIRGRAGSWIDSKVNIPGPGAYEQESKILNTSITRVRIGTSKRDGSAGNEKTPGPGAYEIREINTSAPRCRFGTSPRGSILDETAKSIPGPGTYNLRTEPELPSGGTTMIPRRPMTSLIEAAKIPGPGKYEPKLVGKKSLPAYKIGTSPRAEDDKEGKIKPGPGQYDPKIFHKTAPAFKIGTSQRRPLSESPAPGPGKYDITMKSFDGPKYPIVSRKEDTSLKFVKVIPGPGAYSPQVDRVRTSAPSHRIGSGSRIDFSALTQAPGPGQYDTKGKEQERGPRWRFGSERRKDLLTNMDEIPGPGTYNLPKKFGDVANYVYGKTALKIRL